MVDGARELHRLFQPVDVHERSPTEVEGACTAASGHAPELLRLGDWHLFATPYHQNGRPGRAVAEFARSDGPTVSLLEADDGRLHPPFDLGEAYLNYLSEAWATASSQRRLTPRQLALFYRVKRLIPRRAQLAGRRAVVR